VARYIKLLPGNRAVTNDVYTSTVDKFLVPLRTGSIDTVVVDCTRWLDGATVSTATETAGFFSLVVATPLVTATINGADVWQDGDITITASDGRARIISLGTRAITPAPEKTYD
jgi:hypothetical protein